MQPPNQGQRSLVFIAPGFSEPGGCASHGRKIAEGLAERGWSVHVLTRLASGRSFHRVESDGLSVVELPGFGRRRLGGLLFLLLGIPWVVCRRGPYAFMAMQLSSPATVASLGAMAHRRERLLVFSTLSGPAGEVAFVRNSWTRGIRQLLLSRASALIGQTEEAASELRELVPRGRIEIVPTPVRLPQTVPPLNGLPSAVYTGRIVRAKNLDRLIEAWPGVLSEVPDAKLTLVGAGTESDPVEKRLAHQIADSPELTQSVRMTGWVGDVTPYLDGADVFVFPTTSEGMSNSLVEACARGRVVVASDIPANRAVLGDDYPLLFDPVDADSLRRTLSAALTDEALKVQTREHVLQRVEEFGDQRVFDRIESLLSE